MYATTKENSKQTWLTATIAADATTIVVDSTTNLEPAPNVMTLGEGETAELVRYLAPPSGKTYTVERGFNGTTARAWLAGTAVYRAPTAYDLQMHRIAACYAYAALLGAM
ncbi:MAG TPA: hypothetical protein PLY91_09315 [Methanoregulaceae archaeon]|jgi:hypothetical protein|nr:hypothetical protein [Methanoregulaceae archaeon]